MIHQQHMKCLWQMVKLTNALPCVDGVDVDDGVDDDVDDVDDDDDDDGDDDDDDDEWRWRWWQWRWWQRMVIYIIIIMFSNNQSTQLHTCN